MLAHSLTAHDQLGAGAAATQKSNACLSSEVRAGAKRAKHTLPAWSENHCHPHHHYLSHLHQRRRCHISTVKRN